MRRAERSDMTERMEVMDGVVDRGGGQKAGRKRGNEMTRRGEGMSERRGGEGERLHETSPGA